MRWNKLSVPEFQRYNLLNSETDVFANMFNDHQEPVCPLYITYTCHKINA